MFFTLGCLGVELAFRVDKSPSPIESSTPHKIIKHERL
jgi:hypothetical protein